MVVSWTAEDTSDIPRAEFSFETMLCVDVFLNITWTRCEVSNANAAAVPYESWWHSPAEPPQLPAEGSVGL